jgi:hypothetical protein
VLKYLASDPSSEIDSTVVGSVRNFLFGPPGAGGLDLASLNMQRGRDHGLADYNSIRAAYGLPKVTSFDQITRNVELQAKLQSLYGNVNNVDAWVGMLAEDHPPGSSVGPLISRVLVDQFTRLRDGDRFWYQNAFSGPQLQAIEQTTLANVIRRNTDLTNLQANVFKFQVSVDGRAWLDMNRDAAYQPIERGVPHQKVELVEPESGEVLASTFTDPQGHYRFTTLDGLGVGEYEVRTFVPQGWHATTQIVQTFTITRGGVRLNADFGLLPPRPPMPQPPDGQQPPGMHQPPPQDPSAAILAGSFDDSRIGSDRVVRRRR